MRYLGIDYGSKRVGVALSDEGGRLAFPTVVLENDRKLMARLLILCKKEKVGAVVIGESYDTKTGAPNPIMRKITVFAKEVERITNLRVSLEAEAFSSEEAARFQGPVPGLDASAAAIILQRFLDREREGSS